MLGISSKSDEIRKVENVEELNCCRDLHNTIISEMLFSCLRAGEHNHFQKNYVNDCLSSQAL